MKLKHILRIGAVAFASILLLTACGSKSSKKTVTLATVGTTNPFSYEKKGKLTGYDIEVAKEVFKASDKYDVKYQKTEWTSIFSGLDSDKYQIGANNISYTKERANKYLYSNPTASNPLVLVVPKDSDIKSYNDIAGHSTQVVQGNTTVPMLQKFNKKHKNNQVKLNFTSEDLAHQIRNVSDGKYDFKIFEKISAETIIKEQGLDNLKVIDLPSDQKPYVYFIFAQDQKDLQKFVNKRLKKLYENGTLEKLSKKYLGGSYLPDKKDMK
ncbi:amino acid ABC transporter substrate-binding protein [Streptococcus mutans]|uniref:amino acid ABC transporter substrate-binding protein n=1 Tax=Streptococcus mutans TaxID=1309 RepID=UPI000A368522|nr:amino acid ABC transporter substrate-binding protein [Streptococcus mutans]ARS63250.1 amino acid ABC transporter substrate-binding protein [Streptococcus mutans]